MQPINVLSYNLKFHVAFPELAGLANENNVQILCLQECHAGGLTSEIGDLALKAKTSTGTLGLAIYAQASRFSLSYTASIALHPSLYEQIRIQDRERLLVVELFDHLNQQKILIASIHATHLIATNHLRRKQIDRALTILNTLSDSSPVILAGDFNYPFFHDRLRQTARSAHFALSVPNEPTYYGRKFKGCFDMAATSGLRTKINVLPLGTSDHAPILIHASSTSATS